MSPEELVGQLDIFFSAFDELAEKYKLEKPSKTIPQKLSKNLQDRGIPYLVITNGDDRIVSNQAIFDLFGDPTGVFEPDDMDNLFHSSFQTGVVTLQNVGHTEMLHVHHSIATLVHHRMASI